MIFTRLTITNVGVYRGRHEFELRPQVRDGATPPIVLFGGKNGAGKSTLLDAIRLCLYGRTALGPRIRRADYEAHLRQRLHRAPGHTPAASASVGLLFEHVHAGVLSTYDAVRAWRADDTTVHETVSIYKDGVPFGEIAPEHWNDFLRDLIPPGLADLFFFDGEQIQALADEEREAETLSSAVRGLLNLDLVTRLQADLGVYLRQHDSHDRTRLQQAAAQAEEAYEALEQQVEARRQDLAQVQSRLDWTLSLVAKARAALLREGAGFIGERDMVERRRSEVERELMQAREAIRELAAGLLPFAVAPQWSARLREQLLHEAQAEQATIAVATQQEQAARAALALLQPEFQRAAAPEVAPQAWANIAAAVQQLLAPAPATDDAGPLRHAVSAGERTTLLAWIDDATTQVPDRLRALTQQLAGLEAEQARLTLVLRQTPDETVARPLLDAFNRTAEEKGRLDAERIRVADELRVLEFQLAQRERERRVARQQLAAAGDSNARVQRAAGVQVALDAYGAQISALKLRELEHTIAQFFNLLWRKRPLVREVAIDPRRFTVALYGANRTLLPKSDLSAGEKQLYATALLWALRSVSGRALPIIIDTPMGRLDSDHRHTMLTRFFPNAAHQVILLSTDTEIDTAAFTKIRHAVSHTFRLEFDQAAGCTQVERGYFIQEALA